MSSIIGDKIKISVFGESHGKAVGCVIDGFPAGVFVDDSFIKSVMDRRASKGKLTTPRVEADEPEIISGVKNGYTTGAPICVMIKNENVKSEDYAFDGLVRPSHADYTAHIKYAGFEDQAGGGHFSGRLTAPLTFAGALSIMWLKEKGVGVVAHLLSVGNVNDDPIDPVSNVLPVLRSDFPTFSKDAEEKMKAEIESAEKNGDSVGGVVECAVVGLPVGIGDPIFDSVESKLAHALFGIPGVKGVEFGGGFGITKMRGSEANDGFVFDNGKIRTKTNFSGGIQGGITNGMPVILRVALKPTPSIFTEQDTFNVKTLKCEKIQIKGRHDPCIAVRATAVVETVVASVIADLLVDKI